ncbi:MAG: diaminopimelate decarboxylase, partial [Proteobacteria bacterium]|nr:diaminopimelate decarboxylase [Pseudomonadota bacterium]
MIPEHLGFHRRHDGLWCDEVRLADVASAFETPCYVYSMARLNFQLDRFNSAFKNMNVLPCYAAKANNNPAILRHIAACSSLQWGMDAVSGGELKAGLAAGFSPACMIFSGVGKKDAEIEFALQHDVVLNVESLFELEIIIAMAKARSKRARIGLRVNP